MKKLVLRIILTAVCALFAIALIVGDTIAYSHHGEITSHLSPATEIVDETKVEEANAAGEEVQPMQSGRIQGYVMWFMAGIIVLTLMLLLCL